MAASLPSTADDEGLGGEGDWSLDDSLTGDGGEAGAPGEVLNADVQALAAAWVNEKNAPEVLPYKEELMVSLTEIVKSQQVLVDEQSGSASMSVLSQLYQRDIDRVAYLLSAYLRTRLRKIRDNVLYLLSDSQAMYTLLSPAEQAFCSEVGQLVDQQLTGSATSHLPPRIAKSLPEEGITAPPSPHKFVLVEALVDGASLQAGSETYRPEQGAIAAVDFVHARALLEEGSVRLV